ncbi:MAG: hypothetical protein JY451_03155 [Erythrobacter sp.]|nr:MAG: hypothetical protein JY451_03155 [Erythrobacter sp.]
MGNTRQRVCALAITAVAITILGSCGEDPGGTVDDGTESTATPASLLFPDDFQGVCSGATVSAATAYDPAAGSHKALYFATYRDDFLDQSSSLPADWTVLFSPDTNALAAVDLVLCARRTAATPVKICDGYEDDGNATQNQVRWHTATYELSVREAQSGNVLATSTADATGTNCPMLMSFDGDSDSVDGYASLPDTVIADFLRPFIAP